MKKLMILSCLVLSTSVLYSQSIIVNDTAFICFFGEEFTLSGTLNGRNVYSFSSFDIEWTGAQWQIRAGANIFAFTEANSSPNPPDDDSATANGTPWMAGSSCTGGGPFSIEGDGTQTEIDAPSSTLDQARARASKLELFPNPVSDQLFVKGIQATRTWIRNLQGQEVFSSPGSLPFINLSNIPKGVYLLQQMDDSGQMHNERFVKQ